MSRQLAEGIIDTAELLLIKEQARALASLGEPEQERLDVGKPLKKIAAVPV